MDDNILVLEIKVDSVVFRTIAVQLHTFVLYVPEPVAIHVFQIIGRYLELTQEFKLRQRVKLGNLGRTDFIEDNLEHRTSR